MKLLKTPSRHSGEGRNPFSFPTRSKIKMDRRDDEQELTRVAA